MKKFTYRLKKSVVLGSVFLFAMCGKSNLSVEPESNDKSATAEKVHMVDTAFIGITDNTDTVKTFNVYDNCATFIGTVSANGSNKIIYSNQTSTAITVGGYTSITLTKGTFYYFRRKSCNSGKFLKVKFATGYQNLCNSFNINLCTWSLNTSCGIVSSYSFVTSLPTPC